MTATLPVEVVWLSTSRCSVIHRQSSFPATFFTPSRKGKERFYESFLPHHFAQNGRSQFPPWSTSNICGSQYDHHVTSGFMAKDWLSEPIRGPSRAVPCSPRLLGPAWRANSQRVQKRHSSYSYSSELNQSSRPRADEQTNLAVIRALHHEKDTAGSKFNADKAHGAFLRVVQSRSLDSFSTKDLLLLAHKMIISAENLLYNPETNTRILRAEGHRIESMMRVWSHRTDKEMVSCLAFTLHARALSLQGNIAEATQRLRQASKAQDLDMDKIYEAYKHVIQASRRHNGNNEQTVDYILTQWDQIGDILVGGIPHSKRAQSLAALVSTIVASVQKPLSYIKPRSETLDRRSLHNAARLFAERFIRRLDAMAALQVVEFMRKIGQPVLRDTELDVVRGLIAEDQYRPASALFSSISSEPESPHYMHTALALAARQGDSDAAQTHFEALHVRGLIGEADINMLLYSYAVRGEAESVVELFNRMFPRLPDGGRRGNPSLAVHNVVLFAFAHRANLPAIERWMGEITAQGLQPDGYTFNTILKGVALQNNLKVLSELLSMWRASGWSPNRVTYTQIMTVYAARKQPETVERIFQRALDEGIQPDRRMFSAVLHAHVEAGSWKGVIRAFDFIRTSKKIVLTIDEYNLVLRAYLLMGSPFHLIAKLFSKLEDQQIPPNHITYQILVQSACESGRMGIATSIFAELVRLEEKEKHRALITPDLCTVVMGGFLLYGNQERARVVYDDMLDRGFQPRAVTYARILKAYASQKTASMMENVESFVNSLMNSPLEQRVWEKAVYGPSSSLGFVYAPVLHAYASQRRPESTIKFYQRYVSEGGQPDLGLLTEVLNAYRNSFSVDEALSLWLSIFQLGKDFSQNVTLFPGDPVNVSSRTARSDVLSIPFSIYLDILSTAGLHEEIASAWREYTAAGFTITSHNWNHLCVALVRAGQIRRAFDIVQKVILPYQKLSRETLSKRRTVNPKSPLSFEGVNDHEKEEKEDESEVMMVESSNNLLPADQDYKYHITQAPSEDPKNQYDRRRRVHKYGSIVKRLLQKDKLDHDFMHPLYLMHQLSPSWNTWRLHTTTKMVLLRVLESLRRGFMIQPNRPKMIRQDADIELGNQDIEAKSRAHDDTDKQPFSLKGMNVSDIEEKAPDAPVEKPERPVSPTDSPPSFTPEFEPPTRRTAEYKAPEYPDEPEEERLLAQQLLQELVQHTPDAMNLLSNFAGQQWKRRGPRLYLHLYRNPQRRPIFKTQQVWKSTPNSENRRWWG